MRLNANISSLSWNYIPLKPYICTSPENIKSVESRCIIKKEPVLSRVNNRTSPLLLTLDAMPINIYVIKYNRKKPSNRSINNFRVLIVNKCSRIVKNLLFQCRYACVCVCVCVRPEAINN